MSLSPSRVAQLVLAATTAVFASLLAFGVSAAAAAPYYPPGQSVTSTIYSSRAVWVAVALLVVAAFASIMSLALRRGRPAGPPGPGRIVSLPTEHEPEQLRKAA